MKTASRSERRRFQRSANASMKLRVDRQWLGTLGVWRAFADLKFEVRSLQSANPKPYGPKPKTQWP